MAKKSERQRQRAAEKKKEKAANRKRRAASRSDESALDRQIVKIAALSKHSGQIVSLLMTGRSQSEVSAQLEVSTDEVYQVLTAFEKLPQGIQDIIVKYPEALKNGKLVVALKEATKLVSRDVRGGAHFSIAAQQKLVDILQQGRNTAT